MTDYGWIKLHRKIKDKSYYKKSAYIHLWVHLLLEANHKEKEFMWNGNMILIKEGQLLTGRKELSADTGIPETTIERILNLLENGHQIDQEKTTKFRLITIINWKEYQGGQQTDNKRTTNGQQTDTNKNDKNIKNVNNNIFSFWNEQNIIKHRKLTDKINRKINGALKDYSEEEIKQSISNYSLILKSKEYYWTYEWRLTDFLQRGLEKFLDLEKAKNNYRDKNGERELPISMDKEEWHKFTEGKDLSEINEIQSKYNFNNARGVYTLK